MAEQIPCGDEMNPKDDDKWRETVDNMIRSPNPSFSGDYPPARSFLSRINSDIGSSFASRTDTVTEETINAVEIIQIFDELHEERLMFELRDGVVVNQPQDDNEWRQTSSAITEPIVYGRDQDRDKIVRFLLESAINEDLSIYALVGMAGLGKTTLAKQVFNQFNDDKDTRTIASECDDGRGDCVKLNASEILTELYELKKLLIQTNLFSHKRFERFLFTTGLVKADVLLFKKKRAKILKPAFTVIRDKESKCFLVFIRGTRSIKDILTDLIAAPVPFKLVPFKLRRISGYAHHGMLRAAQWIENRCTSILLKGLRQYPNFKIKIVGHSLGGGTAALLTYKLREIKELSSCTCVTFGPAACVTLELAEFGKSFITSIINGSDMVPTLSTSSLYDFISKGRIKGKNILTAAGSFAKAMMSEHALSLLNHVLMKHRQGSCTSSETSNESHVIEDKLLIGPVSDDEVEEYNEGSDSDDSDDNEDEFMNVPNISDESVCSVPASVNLERRHPLYPPGKIMHIVHSNRIYETPTQLYGKLRLTTGILRHHLIYLYGNKLQKLIDQLEKEQFQYGG